MRSISELAKHYGVVFEEDCGGLRMESYPCGCFSIVCEMGHAHLVEPCMRHPVDWLRGRDPEQLEFPDIVTL